MRLLLYSGALLLTVLFAIGLGWSFENYRPRPLPDQHAGDPRLSFRPAAHLARRAVHEFRALPDDKQQELRDQLIASMSSIDEWAREHASRVSLLCLGERHEDAIRAFIADQLMPRLDYQVLMLETSQAQLRTMLHQFNKGRPVRLLDASLNAILSSAKALKPPAQIIAIDEYQAVATGSARPLGGREDSLVARIRQQWHPAQQYMVLFGALHCRAEPGWMLYRIAHEDERIRRAGIMGAVVLARYREASAQVLMYMLEEIGLGREIVVIPRVSDFPILIQRWLPITADAFAGYDSAILFDDRAKAY